MRRETYNVELVTPCFLGGAAGVSEWRAASIRGQLRWWFRAVAVAETHGDLDQVRRLEDAVFGNTGQSSAVRLRTDAGPEAWAAGGPAPFGEKLDAKQVAAYWGASEPTVGSRLRLGTEKERRSDPIHYLAYGPVVGGNLVRPCLPAGGTAEFEVLWARAVPDVERALFERALWAWLSLGGIGARSRKGFGSLHLLADGGPADSQADFTQRCRDLLASGRAISALPRWSHFSSRSRIFVATEGHRGWQPAMVRLGAWLMAFRRRYGYPADERTAGTVPLANRDYVWVKGNRRQGIPDRAGFGLPLPFGKAETVTWTAPDAGDGEARRASPLLLHVARFGELCFPVLTHLPAELVPGNAKLRYKDRPEAPRPPSPLQLDVVDRFLDDLAAKQLIAEVA